MTFEHFKKNVEKITNGEKIRRFWTLSLSTTEWLLFHEVSLQESRNILGNIFQPYQTVAEVKIPSFILVCRNGAQSALAAFFTQKGYPVLNTARVTLPLKKETEAFLNQFIQACLHKRMVNEQD